MSYLEHYGEGADRRIRRMRWILLCATALLVVTVTLGATFHNFRQERQTRRFFELLNARDYHAAYSLWAPTESDRRGYPMQSFLDDWASRSAERFHIAKSRSCGSGVILTVEDGKGVRERLWVERATLAIGFPPPPETLPKICSL